MSGEWSIPENLTWQYYGECDDFDPHQGVSENTRRREQEELEYRSNQLYGEPDAEFQLLLSNEHDELKSVIAHNEQVFESISALCTLWRNGVMDGVNVIKNIQTILGCRNQIGG